jgi:hypothetical protein
MMAGAIIAAQQPIDIPILGIATAAATVFR